MSYVFMGIIALLYENGKYFFDDLPAISILCLKQEYAHAFRQVLFSLYITDNTAPSAPAADHEYPVQ